MLRHKYSERVRVTSDTVGPSMTKQSFKEESMIDNIIRQYDKTGLFTHLNTSIPRYGDFTLDNVRGSAGMDFHQALVIVKQSQEAFAELPAHLRKRFNNDPGNFLEFVDDPSNFEEAQELGLIDPDFKAPEAPPETPGGDPAPSPQGDPPASEGPPEGQ